MTQEEKAKRYDERLAKARKEYSIHEVNNAIGIMDALERVFPELKESEDEGIKEWLINLVKGHIEWLKDRIREQLSNGQVYGDELVKAKNSLAWLEKQGEEKPAEEYNITSIGSKNAQGKLGEMIKNLKPVNEILEQKPAWSEEDEKILNLIIARLHSHSNVEAEEYDKEYHWLKSLRPQKQFKWSEEDRNKIADYLYCLNVGFTQTAAKQIAKDICDLLRPQKQWKPSEEQMKYLSWIANIKLGNGVVEQEVSKHLNELLEDLKKLKEE